MKRLTAFTRWASAAVVALLAVASIDDSPRLLHATTPDVLSYVGRVGDVSGTGPGQFLYPIGLAIGGPRNRIYITDVEGPAGISDRLQAFEQNSDGTFTPVLTVGGPGDGPGQFANPTGVAVDDNGRILVADTDNHRLQLFDPDGTNPRIIGGYGNFDPLDPDPQYVDAGGNYIGPPATGQANVIGANGLAPVLDRFNYPNRVTLRPGTRLMDSSDLDGRVAVTDQVNHRIVVFNSMLEPLFAFGGFGTTAENGNPLGHLRNPIGIGMDLTHIYVADTDNHRVQIFDQSGTPIRFFGSTAADTYSDPGSDPNADNGPADLSNPNDVQADDQGRLYVADTDRSRILILQEDPQTVQTPRCSSPTAAFAAGRCAVLASDGTWYDARVLGRDGTADGEFIYPQAVAADSLARVVVVDTDKHRFQVFKGARVRTTGTDVEPSSVHSGEPVTVNVTVANEGAVGLTVTVSATPTLSGVLTPPAPVSLAAGASTVVPFTFVTDETGSLRFVINATGASSSGATVRSAAVTTSAVDVGEAIGPKMSASIAAPTTVGANASIPLVVTVTNSGNVALNSVTPTVTVAPANLVELIPSPPPGDRSAPLGG